MKPADLSPSAHIAMPIVFARQLLVAGLLIVPLFAPSTTRGQSVDPKLYSELRWRMIGPFRASRVKAATGVPQQPNVFYQGVVNGGVWKTTDYGRTWIPIFDDQPTGSIGAIAVAPSDPSIIYVGSGEGLQRPDLSTGDGIYKSTDGGKTWTHLGLRDGQQIPQIAVDPRDPNRLYVAVLGHPYGPNEERGIYRSTDGGRSFQKMLGKDENTGGIDVVLDPRDANTVYGVLWEARQGPWENGAFSGPGSGLFKSTDGGTTWRPLTRGLPTFAEGLGRIGIGIAPSNPQRIFASVDAGQRSGLYRSDDAGESWTKITEHPLVVSRGSDMAEVKVDPKNPDIVYTASIVSWKSTDGGRTFNALRGAPGGDDYQRIWINPDNPNIILMGSDQGSVITVNGGESWSSWYNQPTAQFYHVNTDNGFPYQVCSGQQESGSVCIPSRSDDGQITFREFRTVGVEEYGYAVPDPLDPNIIYGGKVTRFDRRTGQVQQVGPRVGRGGAAPGGVSDYRTLRTAPVVFSTVDPRTMYFASNTVWKTTTGGMSWTQISPDLTRTDSIVPPSVGVYASTPAARARHPGVVYTVAPSHVTLSRIWAGSDDGLIHTTADGGAHWTDVTPAELRAKPWSKISIMDAGRFDASTAYAAVNTFRIDDLRPHIYRTHDGGKTWKHITNGIPDGAIINVVREDPKKRGLLFAGSETQVWMSNDDGEHWSSLRLNMPATSIRDLVIKDDDVVLGTHGRAFWILDDIVTLRQLTPAVADRPVTLFAPAQAWRFRWSKWTDTPLPPDEPRAENPPDGAIIDYYLSRGASEARLEIVDSTGRVVRTYSSRDTSMAPQDVGNAPRYWIRPTKVLSKDAGFHRFVWDVRFDRPANAGPGSYPISAIPGNTAREPRGIWALPGRYAVRLTVDGQAFTQPLLIKMDPRVKTPPAAIARTHAITRRLYDAIRRDSTIVAQFGSLRSQLAAAKQNASAVDAANAFEQKLNALAGQGGGGRGGRGGGGGGQPSFASITGDLTTVISVLEGADVTPTTQALAAAARAEREFAALLARWDAVRTTDLSALNARLRQLGLGPVSSPRT
jgi:photosystem II stability/assembly factor-like uncharacterized protein